MNLRDTLITATVCGVTVLSVFLTGATSVAITTIGRDLSFKQSDLQWPLNVFSLSYGCLLLLCGRLSDIIGARKMFLLGTAWLTIWSVYRKSRSSSMSHLSFAANTPAGISIISVHFPPGRAKNTAFAVLGAGQPIGFIVGMILGGLLSQSPGSWRSIFWLQAGLGCALVIVGWFVLPNEETARRYSKGLDWIGALLSTAGFGLLTYDLAESTSTPHGWATPFVPSLLGIAIMIILFFVLWEIRCEARGQPVLVPMSMWTQPGAKMGPVIACVVFAWWAFNTLAYYAPLYYQEVLLLSPLQTSLRLLPMGISGLLTNIATGYLVGIVASQLLILGGIASCMASCIVFALVDVHTSYWAMAFIVMITLPILDVAYTVANMQVCFAFSADSQALAGGIFSVATRLGTSLGLAITSSIATSVSEKYNRAHPNLAATDPSVLMAGFRIAGWTCFGAAAISLLITLFGVRGIGIVGLRVGSSADDKPPGYDV
ncbi:major facilitator superfamily MFS-1 [Obba rivulosa]|uniref:Major facilitator superfamily MFS-1 n=1 Tax=Obba rivulosa TaxID=1052685 RepID=A0A8E2DDY2_9APHY|nr:major facilitator superfamily MFS-1 [Obba rivulosa]